MATSKFLSQWQCELKKSQTLYSKHLGQSQESGIGDKRARRKCNHWWKQTLERQHNQVDFNIFFQKFKAFLNLDWFLSKISNPIFIICSGLNLIWRWMSTRRNMCALRCKSFMKIWISASGFQIFKVTGGKFILN